MSGRGLGVGFYYGLREGRGCKGCQGAMIDVSSLLLLL